MIAAEAVGIAGGVVGIVSAAWTVLRGQRGDAQAEAVKDAALAERVTILETKMALYWESVARSAAALLHSPHPEHARRDWLLERFDALSLTERAELAGLLEQVTGNQQAPAVERLAAAQLLGFLAATA